jgi:hypothetical protein
VFLQVLPVANNSVITAPSIVIFEGILAFHDPNVRAMLDLKVVKTRTMSGLCLLAFVLCIIQLFLEKEEKGNRQHCQTKTKCFWSTVLSLLTQPHQQPSLFFPLCLNFAITHHH